MNTCGETRCFNVQYVVPVLAAPGNTSIGKFAGEQTIPISGFGEACAVTFPAAPAHILKP